MIKTLCTEIKTLCIEIKTLCTEIKTLCIEIKTLCTEIKTLCTESNVRSFHKIFNIFKSKETLLSLRIKQLRAMIIRYTTYFYIQKLILLTKLTHMDPVFLKITTGIITLNSTDHSLFVMFLLL